MSTSFLSRSCLIIKILLFIVVIGGVIFLTKDLGNNEAALQLIHRFGYVGIFFIALVSGFNVVVPLPAASLLPLLADAGLSVILSALLITIGMTLGDGIGFLIGRFGNQHVSPDKLPSWLRRVQEWAFQYRFGPFLLLFFYAGLVPLPNELLVIPTAFLGVSWRIMLPALFLGNAVFNILAALGFSGLLMVV